MTAASGIVHEEKHSEAFTRSGGTFEVAQLWVNLPAKDKAAPPGYQTLLRDEIPVVQLPGGTARIIAGDFDGTQGPAKTFTRVNVWDLRLSAGGEAKLPVPDGQSASLVVLHGEVAVNDSPSIGDRGAETVRESEMAVFERSGEGILVEAKTDAVVLVLAGEPIDEPVVAYGPFVMNTQQEIVEAIEQYRSGRMGHIQERAHAANAR